MFQKNEARSATPIPVIRVISVRKKEFVQLAPHSRSFLSSEHSLYVRLIEKLQIKQSQLWRIH